MKYKKNYQNDGWLWWLFKIILLVSIATVTVLAGTIKEINSHAKHGLILDIDGKGSDNAVF